MQRIGNGNRGEMRNETAYSKLLKKVRLKSAVMIPVPVGVERNLRNAAGQVHKHIDKYGSSWVLDTTKTDSVVTVALTWRTHGAIGTSNVPGPLLPVTSPEKMMFTRNRSLGIVVCTAVAVVIPAIPIRTPLPGVSAHIAASVRTVSSWTVLAYGSGFPHIIIKIAV